MWAYNLMVSNIIRSKQHIFVENNNNKTKQNKNERTKYYFLTIF